MKRRTKISKALHKADLGRYRVWISNQQTYLGMLNFAMILYLYISQDPMGIVWWKWAALIVCMLPLLGAFDIKFIFPSAQKYGFKKNPELVELKEEVKKSTEYLKKIMEKLEIEE